MDAYFEQLCTVKPSSEDVPIAARLLACRDTGRIEPRLHPKLLQIWACLQRGGASHIESAKRISDEFWSDKNATLLKNKRNEHYSQGLLALALFIDLKYPGQEVFAPFGRTSFLPKMTASLAATVDEGDVCLQALVAIIDSRRGQPPADVRSSVESAVAWIVQTSQKYAEPLPAQKWAVSIAHGKRFTDYCNIGFHSAVLLTVATTQQSKRLHSALAAVALPTIQQLSNMPDANTGKRKKQVARSSHGSALTTSSSVGWCPSCTCSYRFGRICHLRHTLA
jgi:hypothetical protein